ncbi:hypothetical protein VG_p43 [Variovorax phage VarioGold]|nr:hypothetical protein VG_p43 [Variovorax phage VarioGold]
MPFGATNLVSVRRKANAPVPRAYRCFYSPVDRYGSPSNTENGVLPFIDLKAVDGEAAVRKAHKKTGCAVAAVERLEHAS